MTDLQRRSRRADQLRRPTPLDPGVSSRPPDAVGERRSDVATRTLTAMWRARWGERRLGPLLERSLDGSARVLHQRRVGDGGPVVDHLIVGPTGVWIVNAAHDTGGLATGDGTGTIASGASREQADRVSPGDPGVQQTIVEALAVVGYDWVPLRPCVCVRNRRRWRSRRVAGVLVATPRRLVGAVLARGALTPPDMVTVASALHERFENVAG